MEWSGGWAHLRTCAMRTTVKQQQRLTCNTQTMRETRILFICCGVVRCGVVRCEGHPHQGEEEEEEEEEEELT